MLVSGGTIRDAAKRLKSTIDRDLTICIQVKQAPPVGDNSVPRLSMLRVHWPGAVKSLSGWSGRAGQGSCRSKPWQPIFQCLENLTRYLPSIGTFFSNAWKNPLAITLVDVPRYGSGRVARSFPMVGKNLSNHWKAERMEPVSLGLLTGRTARRSRPAA